MRLLRTPETLVGKGGTADIIRYDNGVVKLLRCQSATHEPGISPEDDRIYALELWDAECRAYEILSKYPELYRYVADYRGRTVVTSILGPSGEDLSSEYILNAALLLEEIPGTAKKVACISHSLQSRFSWFEGECEEIGVSYLHDASVFEPGTRAEFTLIDFSVLDPTELLTWIASNGGLPQHLRDKWASR